MTEYTIKNFEKLRKRLSFSRKAVAFFTVAGALLFAGIIYLSLCTDISVLDLFGSIGQAKPFQYNFVAYPYYIYSLK